MEISLDPKKLARWLIVIAVGVVGLHLVVQVARFGFGLSYRSGLLRLFDLDFEKNVPTWFSSVLLLVAAALNGIIAAFRRWQRQPHVWHWAGLALLFAFLSLDESASLHERLNDPLREALRTASFLHYAWVIPYGALVLLVLVAYTGFLLKLPPSTRRLFLAAGAIYVGGAIGMEFLDSWHADTFGDKGRLYYVIVTTEETLEIAGILVFVSALCSYLEREFGGVRLRVA